MELDEQRQASMADEGGASGAAMEGEEQREDRAGGEGILDGSKLADAIVVGAAFVLGALAALTAAALWRGGD